MSGGSFDHLHARSAKEVLANPEALERMHRFLVDQGAKKAAGATLEIFDLFSKAQHILDQPGLRSVYKAVENYVSSDWDKQRLKHVIDLFEEQKGG